MEGKGSFTLVSRCVVYSGIEGANLVWWRRGDTAYPDFVVRRCGF
jgi:hypothetical protein